jgi:hypothetical protein
VVPRTGLAGAVVQRSLADWPVVLAALLLLICATTLLATGVVYGDAVATSGLHRALRAASPADRVIDVALSTDPGDLEAIDGAISAELNRAMAASGGDVIRVIRSGSYAEARTASGNVGDLVQLESLDGMEGRATFVDGTWPTAGGTPLQATVSDLAAQGLGLRIGDRLSLVNRLDSAKTAEVAIVGIWRADPADALYAGDPLETSGTITGGSFTTRGPLVVREADLVPLIGGRLDVEWRGIPNIAGLRVDGVTPLRDGSAAVATRLRGAVPATVNPRVTSALPGLLDEVGRSVLVTRSGVILLTIQFAVLAGYAVVLVAGMLVERRRSEIALIRSRGAGGGHLIVMAVLESLLIAVPAVALAPILALGVVAVLGGIGPAAGLGLTDGATISGTAIVVSVLAGLASVIALTLPTLLVAASPAGARASIGRAARTTIAQRLGLDLALIAVAAVALWQLRLYGAPLTRNVRGTLGLDPLLVAAPAIGLVGGAVLALRVLPRIAELGERLLVRGRGLVGALGGRQLARRPLRYTRAALLLMLASALGTLAAAHAATWTRSQADQASFQAVADVRVIASDYASGPSWAAGPAYRAIPGVSAATPVVQVPFDVGHTIRNGTLVGLDPAAVAAVATPPSPGSAGTLAATELAPLAADVTPTPVLPLPGTPARLAVEVDATFRTLGGDADPSVPLDPGTQGLTVALVLRDADGRLLRTGGLSGSLAAAGQRLLFDLTDATAPGLRPASPLALEGLELSLAPPQDVGIQGSVEIASVEVTETATGDGGWTPVTLNGAAAGWRWDRIDGGSVEPFTPARDHPNRLSIGGAMPIYGNTFGPPTMFRLFALPGGATDDDPLVPVVASVAFIAQSGSGIGDELEVSAFGRPLRTRIVGTTSTFAPFDPAAPVLLADLGTVDAVRFGTSGITAAADEWWLRVTPGSEPAVVAALREPSDGAASVIGRQELAHELATDPVPLGLIGILGLGSLAAMLFAGIGFLVSSTVSTSERIGEFALLRALGLSTGQLALWLSIESVFLLVVGLAAGSLLGLVLAWLVLPFATLTQTGLAPIPAPVVVIPWEAIVPVYVAAVVLFVISLWLAQRQLPDVRISGVLRARES